MRAAGFSRWTRADDLPRFIIRGRRNRAGVQDDQVRARAHLGRFQAFGREQRFERGAIRLRSPATEVLDEEFPHVFFILSNGVVGRAVFPRHIRRAVQSWWRRSRMGWPAAGPAGSRTVEQRYRLPVEMLALAQVRLVSAVTDGQPAVGSKVPGASSIPPYHRRERATQRSGRKRGRQTRPAAPSAASR